MRSANHWLARRYGETRIAPRKARLENEISPVLDAAVRLELMGDGGRDSIYYAVVSGQRVGVVRLVNPFKRRPFKKRNAPGPSNLWWALAADRRLNREWNVYCRLSPAMLTPAPVWRTHDAIMCTYFDGQSISKKLASDPRRFWDLTGLALRGLRCLHDHGVAHMDAKVQNILTDADAQRTVFIDFDCTPPPWTDYPEQKAYDYLKLIDSTLKLMPSKQRSDRLRLVELLQRSVDDQTRRAKLELLQQRPRTTRHVMRDRQLRKLLRSVFHRL